MRAMYLFEICGFAFDFYFNCLLSQSWFLTKRCEFSADERI